MSDINGRPAQNWIPLPTPYGSASTSQAVNLVKQHNDPKLTTLLYAISQIVSGYSKDIHGNAGDDKYRYIVDLILTRIKLYLNGEFSTTYLNGVKELINQQISTILSKSINQDLKNLIQSSIQDFFIKYQTKDDINELKSFIEKNQKIQTNKVIQQQDTNQTYEKSNSDIIYIKHALDNNIKLFNELTLHINRAVEDIIGKITFSTNQIIDAVQTPLTKVKNFSIIHSATNRRFVKQEQKQDKLIYDSINNINSVTGNVLDAITRNQVQIDNINKQVNSIISKVDSVSMQTTVLLLEVTGIIAAITVAYLKFINPLVKKIQPILDALSKIEGEFDLSKILDIKEILPMLLQNEFIQGQITTVVSTILKKFVKEFSFKDIIKGSFDTVIEAFKQAKHIKDIIEILSNEQKRKSLVSGISETVKEIKEIINDKDISAFINGPSLDKIINSYNKFDTSKLSSFVDAYNKFDASKLSSFVDAYNKFDASKLSSFTNAFNGIDTKKVDGLVSSFNSIDTRKIDGLVSSFNRIDTSKLSSFTNAFNGIDTKKVDGLVSSFNSLDVSKLSSACSNIVESFNKIDTSKLSNVVTSINKIDTDKIISSFNNLDISKLSAACDSIVSSFNKLDTSKISGMIKSFNQLDIGILNSAISGLNSIDIDNLNGVVSSVNKLNTDKIVSSFNKIDVNKLSGIVDEFNRLNTNKISSIVDQINNIKVDNLSSAFDNIVKSFNKIDTSKLSGTIAALNKIDADRFVSSFNKIDLEKLSGVVESYNKLDADKITNAFNNIDTSKLSAVISSLNSIDTDKFVSSFNKINTDKLSNTFDSIAEAFNKISDQKLNSIKELAPKLTDLLNAMDKVLSNPNFDNLMALTNKIIDFSKAAMENSKKAEQASTPGTAYGKDQNQHAMTQNTAEQQVKNMPQPDGKSMVLLKEIKETIYGEQSKLNKDIQTIKEMSKKASDTANENNGILKQLKDQKAQTINNNTIVAPYQPNTRENPAQEAAK